MNNMAEALSVSRQALLGSHHEEQSAALGTLTGREQRGGSGWTVVA